MNYISLDFIKKCFFWSKYKNDKPNNQQIEINHEMQKCKRIYKYA